MGMCFVKEQLNMNACCDFKDNAFFFFLACLYVFMWNKEVLICLGVSSLPLDSKYLKGCYPTQAAMYNFTKHFS